MKAGRDWGSLEGIGEGCEGLGKVGRDWERPIMLVEPLGATGEC